MSSVVMASAALVTLGFYDRYVLLGGLPLLIMVILERTRQGKTEDSEILRFVSALRRRYDGSNMANALNLQDLSVYSFGSSIRRIVSRRSLGGGFGNDDAKDGNLAELFGIIAMALENGKEVSGELGAFEGRLEREIRMENKRRAATSGMELVTYAGMIVFVPLFGGIVSDILGSSALLMSQQSASLIFGFLVCIEAYVVIMLLMTAYFRNQGSILGMLYSALPKAVLAECVLIFSGSYLNAIL